MLNKFFILSQALILLLCTGWLPACATNVDVPLMAVIVTTHDTLVDITVTIDNNSGVAGFDVALNFDKTALTPITLTKGAILGDDAMIASNLLKPNVDKAKLDSINVVVGSASDIFANGVLFSVQFQAKDNVIRMSPVTLTIKKMASQDLHTITPSIENGCLQFFQAEVIEGSNQGDGYIKLNIRNNTAKAYALALHVATYDDKRKLLHVIREDIPIFAGDNTIDFYDVVGDRVVIMMWDDMCPVINPIMVEKVIK